MPAGIAVAANAPKIAGSQVPTPKLVKPAREETAIFAAGCFWGVEEFFARVPGVKSTRVGYTGGSKANPSYREVSSGSTGHAESVEIQFDPAVVSYEALVTLFFEMHDPTTANRQGNDLGSQYRSAIFFQDSKQKEVAESVMKKVEASKAWKRSLSTQLAPVTKFYPAEEEHQAYLVKHPNGYDNHFYRGLDFGPSLPKVTPPPTRKPPGKAFHDQS